ncbi:hypothetical protein AAF712_005659 [Marasmius tenuissimus]|uniref:Uncharacterized protein n=1 Tax=Marasmius tenuissimus TaxID=585030 RepID=A0ABR3A2J4_9AGAR
MVCLQSGLDDSAGYYSIDNEDPIPFAILGSRPFPSEPENDTVWSNQHVFTTNQVSAGREHEMVITYTGAHNGSRPPQGLNINYFYVTNDWVATNESSPGLNGKGNTPIGAVIGGVLGGVSILIALAGWIWLMMKKRKIQSADMIESNNERSVVTPFKGVRSTRTGADVKNAYGKREELNERDSGFSQTNASSSLIAPPPSYTSY